MRGLSWSLACLGLLASVAVARAETVVVNGKPSDACLAIAAAKQAQWNQTPLLIHETKSFGDGTTRDLETVFTGDRAYAHYTGMPWNTVALNAPERDTKSPEVAAKAMRLESCQLVGPGGQGGTHVYAFTYLRDRDGTHSAGQMTIADSTGLPLAQDITFNATTAKSWMPVKIAATFTYGDAAKVPRDAALAAIDERNRQQRAVLELQQRSMTMGSH